MSHRVHTAAFSPQSAIYLFFAVGACHRHYRCTETNQRRKKRHFCQQGCFLQHNTKRPHPTHCTGEKTEKYQSYVCSHLFGETKKRFSLHVSFLAVLPVLFCSDNVARTVTSAGILRWIALCMLPRGLSFPSAQTHLFRTNLEKTSSKVGGGPREILAERTAPVAVIAFVFLGKYFMLTLPGFNLCQIRRVQPLAQREFAMQPSQR